MNAYLAQIKSNLLLMGRDRGVLFFSYLFPLIFFFVFANSFDAGSNPAAMAQVIAAVLIIGVLGTGFFGAGMRAVADREANILRRFKVAPINAAPIIVASLVSGLVSFLPTIFSFFLFGKLIYHAPVPPNIGSLVVFVCIGVIAFRSLGMIIAAVVNSLQESQIIIQILYLPMLLLSGATFPLSLMPVWVQTIAQFLPATYLYQGMQSIMIGGHSFWQNWPAVLALLVTLLVAVFLGTKLFRWEKEEKIKGTAKLWILAVMAPFLLMGLYQASTRKNIEQDKILARTARRNRSFLFQNVKIFVGNGVVIQDGAVLVRHGKIEQVFNQPAASTKALNAEVIDGAGKTLIPGLIDMHVHIGAPGGTYDNAAQYNQPNADRRRLAAYLYCGITAVRSVGDWLDPSLKLRNAINSGTALGAEFFADGPLFTTEGGHGTEYYKGMPEQMKQQFQKEFVRLPHSPEEARRQVNELRGAGVDGIKAVLESGTASFGLFNHMDVGIYRAVVQQATLDGLPVATHTGNSVDVKDAVDAGSTSVEHGSMTDLIPNTTWTEAKAKNVAYDPTLTVFEAFTAVARGDTSVIDRSLVQQVGPADLLASTKAHILAEGKKQKEHRDNGAFKDRLNTNLMNAYRAGVSLITGTDAGNVGVVHGPTVHRELQLWVKAGIPPSVALQAATGNAAKVLHADGRIGLIEKDRDATFLLLDGNPLEDISNTERLSLVMFRGERIDRPELLNQDK